MEDRNWILYCHLFPNNKQYFGISQNLKQRWSYNGRNYTKNGQRKIYNAIQKYGWNNIRHIIVAENLTEKEAKNAEKTFIAIFNTCHDTTKGYNMTEGGEGASGLKHSEKTKNRLRELNTGKNNPRYGVHYNMSNATKEKLRAAHKGRKKDILSVQKSAEKIKKIVYKYDLNGKFICSYPSIKEAYIDMKKEINGNISKCCAGKSKTAYGYIWKHIN